MSVHYVDTYFTFSYLMKTYHFCFVLCTVNHWFPRMLVLEANSSQLESKHDPHLTSLLTAGAFVPRSPPSSL